MRIYVSVLDRLPADFQQQTLLRIHRQRLPRTNPKELRIKLRRVINKPSLPHITRADTLRIFIK